MTNQEHNTRSNAWWLVIFLVGLVVATFLAAATLTGHEKAGDYASFAFFQLSTACVAACNMRARNACYSFSAIVAIMSIMLSTYVLLSGFL